MSSKKLGMTRFSTPNAVTFLGIVLYRRSFAGLAIGVVLSGGVGGFIKLYSARKNEQSRKGGGLSSRCNGI